MELGKVLGAGKRLGTKTLGKRWALEPLASDRQLEYWQALMELACQLDISRMLGYITDTQRKELFATINNLAIKINNFISFIRKELKESV